MEPRKKKRSALLNFILFVGFFLATATFTGRSNPYELLTLYPVFILGLYIMCIVLRFKWSTTHCIVWILAIFRCLFIKGKIETLVSTPVYVESTGLLFISNILLGVTATICALALIFKLLITCPPKTALSKFLHIIGCPILVSMLVVSVLATHSYYKEETSPPLNIAEMEEDKTYWVRNPYLLDDYIHKEYKSNSDNPGYVYYLPCRVCIDGDNYYTYIRVSKASYFDYIYDNENSLNNRQMGENLRKTINNEEVSIKFKDWCNKNNIPDESILKYGLAS